MSTTDKTADKLVQSIRKTKTATPTTDKAPAVAAVSTAPPKTAVRSVEKKPAPAAKPASSLKATPAAEEPVRSFARSGRVWPD